jgi:phytoene synthase
LSDDPLTRATQPGSLRYFAVMFAPAAARPLLQALHAFDAEIEDTVVATSHDIAHTRMQWWRSEVDRLLAGQPQHPVTRALLPLRELAPGELPLLHERMVAADIDLARMTFATRGELDVYHYLAGGALHTLAAAASRQGTPSESERAFARALGAAVVGAESLRDLRPRLQAGRLPFALDELATRGIAPDGLLRTTPPAPATLELFDATLQALRAELDRLPDLLSDAERPVQRHGLVLGALHSRLLARIDHREGIARTRAEVPSWPRLWTAWRTALRYA